jgi:hypothetical protein
MSSTDNKTELMSQRSLKTGLKCSICDWPSTGESGGDGGASAFVLFE